MKEVLACLLSRRRFRCNKYVSGLYRGRSVGSEKTMDESVSQKFEGRAIPCGINMCLAVSHRGLICKWFGIDSLYKEQINRYNNRRP